MTLRLIVPADEEMIPRLLSNELYEGARPLVRDNEKEKSPGFTGTEFQARQIAEMLALGMDEVTISKVFKIGVPLLKFYYAQEFDTAEHLVNARVAKVALDLALSGRNPDMTQFWLRSRAGWTESRRVELTGADGGPIEVATAREGLMKIVVDYEGEDRATSTAPALLSGPTTVEDAAAAPLPAN